MKRIYADIKRDNRTQLCLKSINFDKKFQFKELNTKFPKSFRVGKQLESLEQFKYDAEHNLCLALEEDFLLKVWKLPDITNSNRENEAVELIQTINVCSVRHLEIRCFALVPGAKQVVVAYTDVMRSPFEIDVFDIETGRRDYSLKGHTQVVNDLAFTPKGELISCSFDETIRIWDLKTRRCVKCIEIYERGICYRTMYAFHSSLYSDRDQCRLSNMLLCTGYGFIHTYEMESWQRVYCGIDTRAIFGFTKFIGFPTGDFAYFDTERPFYGRLQGFERQYPCWEVSICHIPEPSANRLMYHPSGVACIACVSNNRAPFKPNLYFWDVLESPTDKMDQSFLNLEFEHDIKDIQCLVDDKFIVIFDDNDERAPMLCTFPDNCVTGIEPYQHPSEIKFVAPEISKTKKGVSYFVDVSGARHHYFLHENKDSSVDLYVYDTTRGEIYKNNECIFLDMKLPDADLGENIDEKQQHLILENLNYCPQFKDPFSYLRFVDIKWSIQTEPHALFAKYNESDSTFDAYDPGNGLLVHRFSNAPSDPGFRQFLFQMQGFIPCDYWGIDEFGHFFRVKPHENDYMVEFYDYKKLMKIYDMILDEREIKKYIEFSKCTPPLVTDLSLDLVMFHHKYVQEHRKDMSEEDVTQELKTARKNTDDAAIRVSEATQKMTAFCFDGNILDIVELVQERTDALQHMEDCLFEEQKLQPAPCYQEW